MRKIWIPQTIAILMLIWAYYPGNPYGYYNLLRLICCAVFLYLSVSAYNRKDNNWIWVFGVMAILYNPFIKIYLNREMWSIVNIITIFVTLASIFLLKLKSDNKVEE
ncbi:MAG: DUF6804 family protein [bacterium]